MDKVYIIMEHDADPYCGSHFVAAFTTKLKATEYIGARNVAKGTNYYTSQWYIIEPDLN